MNRGGGAVERMGGKMCYVHACVLDGLQCCACGDGTAGGVGGTDQTDRRHVHCTGCLQSRQCRSFYRFRRKHCVTVLAPQQAPTPIPTPTVACTHL
jgi:hypothetical protein